METQLSFFVNVMCVNARRCARARGQVSSNRTWQVGLVSVESDTGNHMVAKKCTRVPKGYACEKWGDPLGFAD